MKLGIMQPYFFPYLGYWQLINAVDQYVICDDVNYIKGGWIRRNQIIINNKAQYITLQLSQASQNKLINEIELLDHGVHNCKMVDIIKSYYKKAPHYEETIQLIEDIICHRETNLARYLANSIREISAYLKIDTPLVMSTDIGKNCGFRCQDRVIDICQRLHANEYINACGGVALYSKDDFAAHGIQLKFIKTRDVHYRQFNDDFIPNLSIIDVMMFNSLEEIRQLLNEYDLC